MEHLALKFIWDGDEAKIRPADVHRIEEMVAEGDWITAADFLVDVQWEAKKLYEEIMAFKRQSHAAQCGAAQ